MPTYNFKYITVVPTADVSVFELFILIVFQGIFTYNFQWFILHFVFFQNYIDIKLSGTKKKTPAVVFKHRKIKK